MTSGDQRTRAMGFPHLPVDAAFRPLLSCLANVRPTARAGIQMQNYLVLSFAACEHVATA
jgi:hypothetical protein